MLNVNEHKFDYEINSNIYAVAVLFNVSKFHIWYKIELIVKTSVPKLMGT